MSQQHESITGALNVIREEYPEILITEYQPDVSSPRSDVWLEASSDQDDGNTPSILHDWSSVNSLTEQSDEPVNIGVQLVFDVQDWAIGLELAPYYTRSEGGEPVFIRDMTKRRSFDVDAKPEQIAQSLSEFLSSTPALTPKAKKADRIMETLTAEKQGGGTAEGYDDTVQAVQKLKDKSCDLKTFKAGAKFFDWQVKLLKELDKNDMSGLQKLSITNRQERLRDAEKTYHDLGKSSPEVAKSQQKSRESDRGLELA